MKEFINDPVIIRSWSDAKITKMAEKLKIRVSRSPTAYNNYVRDEMERLVSSDLSPKEKFRNIGQKWTAHDSPHRCTKSLKEAMTKKLCPKCPTDDEGRTSIEWELPNGRTIALNTNLLHDGPASDKSPRPTTSQKMIALRAHAPEKQGLRAQASKNSASLNHDAPTSPALPRRLESTKQETSKASPKKGASRKTPPKMPTDLAENATLVSDKSRCPTETPFYCVSGAQQKWCVRDRADCIKSNDAFRLSDLKRRKCSKNSKETGETCQQ
jgi:hypothetical protein